MGVLAERLEREMAKGTKDTKEVKKFIVLEGGVSNDS